MTREKRRFYTKRDFTTNTTASHASPYKFEADTYNPPSSSRASVFNSWENKPSGNFDKRFPPGMLPPEELEHEASDPEKTNPEDSDGNSKRLESELRKPESVPSVAEAEPEEEGVARDLEPDPATPVDVVDCFNSMSITRDSELPELVPSIGEDMRVTSPGLEAFITDELELAQLDPMDFIDALDTMSTHCCWD